MKSKGDAANECVQKILENPGTYTLLKNNCVNHVRNTLKSAGIESSDSIKPKVFFDEFKKAVSSNEE